MNIHFIQEIAYNSFSIKPHGRIRQNAVYNHTRFRSTEKSLNQAESSVSANKKKTKNHVGKNQQTNEQTQETTLSEHRTAFCGFIFPFEKTSNSETLSFDCEKPHTVAITDHQQKREYRMQFNYPGKKDCLWVTPTAKQTSAFSKFYVDQDENLVEFKFKQPEKKQRSRAEESAGHAHIHLACGIEYTAPFLETQGKVTLQQNQPHILKIGGNHFFLHFSPNGALSIQTTENNFIAYSLMGWVRLLDFAGVPATRQVSSKQWPFCS
ncbi:MAG: hypothetical protein HC848_08075 [Limnobacter sp.]|nr:hypothetical protein [Limnobacter sp.]